jgi:opacity protein-like surface antigen
MKRISVWAAATALACSFATLVRGQNSTLPKWEIGLSAGAFIYQGDLAPSITGSYKPSLISPGASLYGSRILNRFLALRTSLTVAGLKGDDRKYDGEAWRQARALKFHTSVVEVAETFVWDLFGNNDDHTRARFSPYLFAGVGYSFLRVRRDASRFDTSYFGAQSVIVNGLKADLATNTPRGVAIVPVGVGVRYAATPAWSVALEAAYRFSSTDYLDGFSKVGDPSRNDHYYSFSLGVGYTFLKGKGLGCPVLKN